MAKSKLIQKVRAALALDEPSAAPYNHFAANRISAAPYRGMVWRVSGMDTDSLGQRT